MSAAASSCLSIVALSSFCWRRPKAMLSRTLMWRVERVVLEDHRDVALVRGTLGHVGAVEADRARRRRLQPGDAAECRALAATRRPQEGQELAVGQVDIQGVHRMDGAELLGQVIEGDAGQDVSFVSL